MYKYLIVVIATALALAACAPIQQIPTDQEQPAPSAQQTAEISTAPVLATAIQASGPAECRVTAKTEPNPTIEAILPRVAETDWAKGPESASVIITEYSDFQ